MIFVTIVGKKDGIEAIARYIESLGHCIFDLDCCDSEKGKRGHDSLAALKQRLIFAISSDVTLPHRGESYDEVWFVGTTKEIQMYSKELAETEDKIMDRTICLDPQEVHETLRDEYVYSLVRNAILQVQKKLKEI